MRTHRFWFPGLGVVGLLLIPITTQALSFSDFVTLTAEGETTGYTDASGYSVAGGDLNGDGYDDLIIGALGGAPASGSGDGGGNVHIIYGSSSLATNSSLSDSITLRASVSSGFDMAGYAVASGGDFNGDGYDDLLIGDPSSDILGTDIGEVVFIPGQATEFSSGDLLDASEDTVSITGVVAGDRNGASVAFAGDVNNDGYDDILIGAPDSDLRGTNKGIVYLIYGSTSGQFPADLTSSDQIFYGYYSSEQAGSKVAPAGDVNADGFDDFLISAPYSDGGGTDAGVVYLVYGRSSSSSYSRYLSIEGIQFSGEAAGDYAGSAIGATDINNDGYTDILIGAQRNSDYALNAGSVYVVYGNSSILTDSSLGASSIVQITGEERGAQFGKSISAAGDVTNDGYNDFWAGGYNNASALYLVEGLATTIDSGNIAQEAYLSMYGGDDDIGYALAGNFDHNQDGHPEVLVGSPSYILETGINYLGYLAVDADGDGVIGSTGILMEGEDCNDSDATIDGYQAYYIDNDGDGLGSAATSLQACSFTAPDGYVSNANDMNDSTTTSYDSMTDADGDGVAIELDCNDNDGSINTPQIYYEDNDGDGLGSETSAFFCTSSTPPNGYVSNSTDHNDTDADNDTWSTSEDCNDYDGTLSTTLVAYVDSDGDGLGASTGTTLCANSIPSGYVSNGNDPDDSTPTEYDEETDTDNDDSGIVADCNDADSSVSVLQMYYQDSDGDGYGTSINTVLCSGSAPAGYTTNINDSDDSNDTIFDSTLDQDEDGVSIGSDCDDNNAGVSTYQTYYIDSDGDGVGSITGGISLCSNIAPEGYTANTEDLNDSLVNTVLEYDDDNVDNDGDGEIDEVNTIEENGLHPDLSGTDPASSSDYAELVTSVRGKNNGTIRVKYNDHAVYKYNIFSVDTDELTKIKSYKSEGYINVLHPKGKKLALINVYTGGILDRVDLAKKKYQKLSLKHLDIREDDKIEAVVTMKKGEKVIVTVVKVVPAQHNLIKRDSLVVDNNKIVPKKTKVNKHQILLRNSNGKVLERIKVTGKYQLKLVE